MNSLCSRQRRLTKTLSDESGLALFFVLDSFFVSQVQRSPNAKPTIIISSNKRRTAREHSKSEAETKKDAYKRNE